MIVLTTYWSVCQQLYTMLQFHVTLRLYCIITGVIYNIITHLCLLDFPQINANITSINSYFSYMNEDIQQSLFQYSSAHKILRVFKKCTVTFPELS